MKGTISVCLFWVFFSIFFICGKCSRRHLPVLFVLHFLIKEMWRDMWLFTKADKTHITMVQEDKKPFACPVCYVKYMFIERHIGSVHERKKSVNRIISKENNPLSDPYSQQYLSLNIQKWYNGLFSSAAYKQRLIS